jgi:hypothetical protein
MGLSASQIFLQRFGGRRGNDVRGRASEDKDCRESNYSRYKEPDYRIRYRSATHDVFHRYFLFDNILDGFHGTGGFDASASVKVGALLISTCFVISVGLVLESTPARYPRHAVTMDANGVTLELVSFQIMQYAKVITPITVQHAIVRMTRKMMFLLDCGGVSPFILCQATPESR